MTAIQKALTLAAFATAALVGFFVLPLTHATLWLIFLVVAFPVSIAFVSGAADGTRFSAAELIEIYKESINALPRLLQFLRPPDDQNKE